MELAEAGSKELDIVFRNARIVDGSGNPYFVGDVGVRKGEIAFVSHGRTHGIRSGARLTLDCSGLILCPGFIDIHNHSDAAIFVHPEALNYVTQGVTTLVVGNCGSSAAPIGVDESLETGFSNNFEGIKKWRSFGAYLDELDKLPKSVNICTLIGHGQVRKAVLGLTDRAPGEEELARMKDHIREAMASGAFGLSTGLIYSPGMYASAAEITELARVAAEFGGLYCTHLRSEADLEIDAVMEAIQIGRMTGCRVQIAHLKASGKRNWGTVRTVLDIMEYARRLGVEVTCDVYPFAPSGASLFILFPGWARSRGKDGLLELLKDAETRDRIRSELQRPAFDWENIYFDAGPDGLMITLSRVHPEYQGKTLSEVARIRGENPLDAVLSLAEEDIDMSMVAGGMSEDDNRAALAHRLSMVSSDSSVTEFGSGMPHPRAYCAFTRVISRFVRDEALLTLEQAVHKMTGFPAWKLGLADRGAIRPGARADIVVFDFWKMKDTSDFGDPHHYSEGVVHLLVNGEFVVKDGKPTGSMPGQLLRHRSS
ncbi:MAG TPA: D-aminoacylase [Firmicutes bacterium]|nr:D-aminoacylase [Candidatus Fermentithermobacillaceae bacterium]